MEYTLWVKNIPKDKREKEITDYFEKLSTQQFEVKVKSVSLVYDLKELKIRRNGLIK